MATCCADIICVQLKKDLFFKQGLSKPIDLLNHGKISEWKVMFEIMKGFESKKENSC